jgi:glycerophosphoryl diester phosphodiesterase
MTRVFAHRGDHSIAPETTIEAFVAAIAAGAHGVELDVRRSRDGALVVHHDAEVAGIGVISQLDVRALPASVCLLDEAMTALAPVVVNVEIKNDPDEPGYDPSGSLSHDVVSLLEERGDLDRVIVSSFDLLTLDAVRQASASVPTGLLLCYTAEPTRAIEVCLSHGIGAVHPFVLAVTAENVAAAHDAGLDVNTWTVNARHDIEAMAALAVDVVITDEVALALEATEVTPER